jgi:hypothetical protein
MENSSSSDGGSGPQKISLPNRSEPAPPSKQGGGKKKPAWLLPVSLLLFLIIGFVLIFALKPGEDKPTELQEASEEVSKTEELSPSTPQSESKRNFQVLTPEELQELQKKAKAAVSNQANQNRSHAFQRVLFGKAASQLTDADSAMAANNFHDAQIGYEDTVETINTLVESYEVAGEISQVKSEIESSQNTLSQKAASLLKTNIYESVLNRVEEADARLNEGKFKEALAQLQVVKQSLNELIEDGEKQFQAVLQAGLKALNSGDGEAAKEHLILAQALRPNDSFIARQLERAEVINQVFTHYKQGLDFEQQGLYASARVEYQKALDLDPDSVNINARLQDLNQNLNPELFEKALAEGLKALTNGNGDAAVELLGKATAIMPADEQARSALVEARELQRRQNVERLISTGQQALENSQWEPARIAFQEALDYEPSSQDSQRGLAEANEQIAREEQLKQLLHEAEIFERNGEFDKALIVLREGHQLADPAGVVSEKIGLLEGILEEQSKPQTVKIISDGQTDIEIHKVGKFNPARQLELDLRPGEYTIIGSRLMYRDVRYTLNIEVGEQTESLEVICRDKL